MTLELTHPKCPLCIGREDVPQVFVRLCDASVKCIHSSLGSAHGDQQDMPDSSKPAESCVQMVWLGKQIKQQLTDLKTDLNIRSFSKENIDSSLNVSLKIVNVPLEQEVCSMRNKEMAIARMQHSHALLNVLQKDTQSSPIQTLMNHSMDICKKIQSVQTRNRVLEEKLSNIRRKRMEMRIGQQDLFKQVKKLEENSNMLDQVEAKIQIMGRENMDSILNNVTLIQEIFQRLTLTAQVHWAEDPHLTHLLVKMKESPLS
ncbi:centromere protein H-like [Ascaphus truei]|uniref:centromere protein H-like n=1 Tax=Ascaphus truei TaxID=8439 RepID=UPI003F5AD8D7